MLKRYILVITLLGILTINCVSAINPHNKSSFINENGIPRIINYSPEEYDANPMNWAMVEDDNGLLYVANLSCILQYDGVSWRLIILPNKSNS